MSRLTRWVLPPVLLAAGVMLFSPISLAKPDYMKKEKKSCTYCHVAPDKKGLNEVGKCYAEHGHSLDQCKPQKVGIGD